MYQCQYQLVENGGVTYECMNYDALKLNFVNKDLVDVSIFYS